MDKFGLTELITAFSKLYGSGIFKGFGAQNNQSNQNQAAKPQDPPTEQAAVKKKKPTGGALIAAMKKHDEIVKRVTKSR